MTRHTLFKQRLHLIWLQPSFRHGFLLLIGILAVGFIGPYLTPYGPTQGDLGEGLLAPSWQHWLGTDKQGWDVWTRLVYGAKTSFYIIAVVGLVVGPFSLIIGLLAGYFGGWVDTILMRITDIFLCFPKLVIALAVAAAAGPGLDHCVMAIAITAWPSIARLIRAEVLTLKHRSFILAARAQGASNCHILLHHILPLCMPSLITRLTLELGGVVLIAAGLGFLGVGVQPPQPEWGAMMAEGRSYFLQAPWVIIAPGVAILLTSLCFNLLGDGLNDYLNPHTRYYQK